MKVDLTKLCKHWNRLQLSLAVLFSVALLGLVYLAIDFFNEINTSGASLDTLFFVTLGVLINTYIVYTTWADSATLSELAFKRLRRMFLIILILQLSAVVLGVCMFVFILYVFSEGVIFIDLELKKQINALEVVSAFFIGSGSISAIYTIWNLFAINSVLNSQIPGLNASLKKILLERYLTYSKAPREASWLIRIDQPVGLLWISVGAICFLVAAKVDDFLWNIALQEKSPPQLFQYASSAVGVFGAWCILKGRTFFTPKGEACLAIDQRQPILYLRSFQDEHSDAVSFFWPQPRIDRSTEMKLAKYFKPIGPFVAIGSPKDAQPKLGAIRLLRSDDKWQVEVASLMNNARNIVASVGISPWIKWEISEIVARKHLQKTLFMFPITLQWGSMFQRFRRWALAESWILEEKAQEALRIKVLEESAGVKLQDQVAADEFVLSTVLLKSNLLVLVSKKPSSNALVLALIVAHSLQAKYQNETAVAEQPPVSTQGQA